VTAARKQRRRSRAADDVLEESDATLLDLVDNLLNRGVVLRGEITMGVAGVDLIYLELRALLCAADRILG
jgi:hypothetical protein